MTARRGDKPGMWRLLAWVKGEAPLWGREERRGEELARQLAESRRTRQEARRALDDWDRAVAAMRRQGFPVSEAMRVRHGPER
jgi:hypothetical protein